MKKFNNYIKAEWSKDDTCYKIHFNYQDGKGFMTIAEFDYDDFVDNCWAKNGTMTAERLKVIDEGFEWFTLGLWEKSHEGTQEWLRKEIYDCVASGWGDDQEKEEELLKEMRNYEKERTFDDSLILTKEEEEEMEKFAKKHSFY